MRTTEERCNAVRNRTRKLKRRRADRVLIILVCLMALPLADLAGRTVTGGTASPYASGMGLFGATSIFGPEAGGYVLVAVVAAAVAVLVTLIVVLRRRRTSDEDEEDTM